MNAAALKTQYKYAKPQATIIIDTDCFGPKDLEKKPSSRATISLGEMGIDSDRVVAFPISKMVKDCLVDSGMDNKAILKCRNMFALGLVCWLFNRDLELVFNFLRGKFAKNRSSPRIISRWCRRDTTADKRTRVGASHLPHRIPR